MNYLTVPLHSRTASFRDPEFQNFHRTLPLPPPATCIGLAGAALGLAPQDAQAYFAEGEWQIGIAGSSQGVATDLWKYDDFKTGSILIREILYDNLFVIVFGHSDQAKLEELADAFRHPRYALSCGPSDSLCSVRLADLSITPTPGESDTMVHCYVDGDIVADALSAVTEGGSAAFSIRTTSTPVAQDLPVRFDYGKGGIRMLRERRMISYLQYPARLPAAIPGIHFVPNNSTSDEQGFFVPVFPL
jgi:CRISPR-associated protein Cas5t